MPIILGLDASSVTLGWALWNGSTAPAHGTIMLKGDLTQRLCLAEIAVQELLRKHAPDAVALEGATTRYPGHVIAQQRVCGVILLVIARLGMLSLEIAPATAKKALTGTGKADKTLMRMNARGYIGECDEHQADALGCAVAAWPLVRIEEISDGRTTIPVAGWAHDGC